MLCRHCSGPRRRLTRCLQLLYEISGAGEEDAPAGVDERGAERCREMRFADAAGTKQWNVDTLIDEGFALRQAGRGMSLFHFGCSEAQDPSEASLGSCTHAYGTGAGVRGAGKRPASIYFEPGTFLGLYKIAHSKSMVDKWDNFAFRPVAAGKAQSGRGNDRRAHGVQAHSIRTSQQT